MEIIAVGVHAVEGRVAVESEAAADRPVLAEEVGGACSDEEIDTDATRVLMVTVFV